MRVTFVLPFYSRRPIGGLRVVYEYANGLVDRGHEVTVVHPRSVPDLMHAPGIKSRVSRWIDRAVALGGVSWMHLNPAVRLRHVDSIHDPAIPDAEIVIATSWQTAAPVFALSSRKGEKYYVVMDFYPYLASREQLESTWRLGLRLATISDWLTGLVRAAGVHPDYVRTISCGVSACHSARTPPASRPPGIVMMYGLGNYKAAADGLAALRMVREDFGEVPVRLFGANLSRRPAGIPEWAEYYPLLSDSGISDLYNRSSVFVSSSLAEGFCLPAAEAMASGCAVVATDCGGILDFAQNEHNALLSEAARPSELAGNILRVLRDDDLRLRLVEEGMRTISGFTWPAAVGRLQAFLSHEV